MSLSKGQPELMRGAFDFETWGHLDQDRELTPVTSIKALCCGMVVQGPNGYESAYVEDESPNRKQTEASANAMVELAMQYMMSRQDVKEWWAHNMGKYDGLFLSSAVIRLGWKQRAIMAGGSRVIHLEITAPSGLKMHVCDSFALVSDPLKKAAESFELPSRKLFTAADYEVDMRDMDKDRLRDGCLLDAQLILELLNKVESLVQDWGGKIRRTASSTALGIVKASLAEIDEKLPSHWDNPGLNPLAEQSYYGGRVEVYNHLPSTLQKEFDRNSSYPAEMATELPWEFERHVLGRTAQKEFNGSASMLCRAVVNVPKQQQLPCLPFRIDATSGVFFPVGLWEGWFPANELRYAARGGFAQVDVKEGLVYSTQQPFADFVRKIYALKSKNDSGAVRSFAKLILNGCYGKFGEKPEHEEFVTYATSAEGEHYAPIIGGTPLYGDDYRMLVVHNNRWASHAHYAIASYITGGARLSLHKAQLKASKLSYSDSDSIHCEEWNGDESKELGEFSLKRSGFKGEYLAPKMYRLVPQAEAFGFKDNKAQHACKGFPTDRESFNLMIESAIDAQLEIPLQERRAVQATRMRLFKSQLKGASGRPATEVARVRMPKRWRGMSMKRRPLANGTTLPWTVSELRAGEHMSAVSPVLLKIMRKLGKVA